MAEGLSLSAGMMTELRTTDPLWHESQKVANRMAEQHRLAEDERQQFLHYVRHIRQLLYIVMAQNRPGHLSV